ncbi:hypothetical protein, partial [uncultured Legionella sp.]|uniref:hypothetical protein n=1 Tax=uncultured Legionella sp. TaxID=210934 RepID=UPI0026189B1E
AGTTFFEFAKPVVYGGDYVVTIAAQPTGLSCKTINGIGTNVTANVTDVQVNCAPLSVGDAYASGVVYRIDGNTAYIISPSDVVTDVIWGPDNVNVATSADNTFDIVSDNTYTALAGSNFPAAEVCRNYTAGSGENTWFLPAVNEWALIVEHLTRIYQKSSESGFTWFTTGSEYWSSTEGGSLFAYARRFSGPDWSHEYNDYRGFEQRIRCVQAVTF